MNRRLAVFAVAALLGALAAGCSDDASGDPCDENGAGQCVDGTGTALYCENNVWKDYKCPGPLACHVEGTGENERAVCDQSGVAEGSPCPTASEGRFTCSAGAAAILLCRGGALSLYEACDAGRACTLDRNIFACQ